LLQNAAYELAFDTRGEDLAARRESLEVPVMALRALLASNDPEQIAIAWAVLRCRAGDTATLTGISHITGLGAGSSVPFELVIRGGGPGATAVLTTKGSPTLTFHEILTEGSFQVSSDQ
jgi:hypothetical protein